MECVTIGNATLYCADSLAVLLGLLGELAGVDGLITDPPYSSGGQFRGDRTGGTAEKYQNSNSGLKGALSEFTGDNRDQRGFAFWSALWLSAAREACKTGAAGCVFTDWRQLPTTTDYYQAGGWVWRGVVPWVKRTARPTDGRFKAACEYVVWGSNGPMPFEREVPMLPGFYEYLTPRDRIHITQKPVELMRDIVRIVPEGGLVLDPFMGSGTTGVAALQLGRRFVGVELDSTIFNQACERIAAATAQGELLDGHDGPVEQMPLGGAEI